jgi:hypothetical protein
LGRFALLSRQLKLGSPGRLLMRLFRFLSVEGVSRPEARNSGHFFSGSRDSNSLLDASIQPC